jgi:uncharacterized protein YndB with AHSA1/START domain
MSIMTAHHTIVVKRGYDALPTRVFAALIFGPKDGPRYAEDGRYEDIVEDRRLCYSMTIASDGTRLTTSMVTVEFRPNGTRTDLKVTDQLAILDGGDKPEGREQGWGETLDKLPAELLR